MSSDGSRWTARNIPDIPRESAMNGHPGLDGGFNTCKQHRGDFWRGYLLIAGGLSLGSPAARAQGPGPSGSLGGYGGSMSDTGSGMGMGGPVIPYAGRFGGFMPYRMGGGGSLSFQSRGTSAMGSARTSFSLSPMSGGMSSMSGGMGQGLGTGPARFRPRSRAGWGWAAACSRCRHARHGRDAAELRLPVPAAAEPPVALLRRARACRCDRPEASPQRTGGPPGLASGTAGAGRKGRTCRGGSGACGRGAWRARAGAR